MDRNSGRHRPTQDLSPLLPDLEGGGPGWFILLTFSSWGLSLSKPISDWSQASLGYAIFLSLLFSGWETTLNKISTFLVLLPWEGKMYTCVTLARDLSPLCSTGQVVGWTIKYTRMGRQADAQYCTELPTWAFPSEVRGQPKWYQPLNHLGRAIETSIKSAFLRTSKLCVFFFNFMGKANNRVFVFHQKS